MNFSKRNSQAPSLPVVDLGKAVASQLIVLHHFALYGPMSDVASPLLGGLLVWLVDHARLAVQVFLVVGGYLAARSLLPQPGAEPTRRSGNLLLTLGHRARRLLPPYVVALLAAVWCAWCARSLIDYPTIPEAPTLWQFTANLFMLQDVLEENALSAGVWYIAIDFQLYAMLALLCTWRASSAVDARRRGVWTALAVVVMTAASLVSFNRDRTMDAWGIYFFGAYGLGILAQWASTGPQARRWRWVLGVLIALALAVEWRSRIALAGAVALVLALGVGNRITLSAASRRLVAWLSRISYTVFLLHYPVSMVVGAAFYRLWPASSGMHALGLLAAWGLSLLAGDWLQSALEPGSARPVMASAFASARAAVAQAGLRLRALGQFRPFGPGHYGAEETRLWRQ